MPAVYKSRAVIHLVQISEFSVSRSSAPTLKMKMTMKKLLSAFFLGLFAAVHASPLNTATQTPALPAEDDLHEVEMDGYILHHARLTTDSPKKNTTAQASQQPSFESTTEGSGDTLWLKSTTAAPSLVPSTTEGSGDTLWLKSTTAAPSLVPLTTEGSGDTLWLKSTTTAPSLVPSTTEGSGDSATSWFESTTTAPSFISSTTEASVDSTTSRFESRGAESTTTAPSFFESTTEGSGETSWLESTTTAPSVLESTTEGSGATSGPVESSGEEPTTVSVSLPNPDDSTSDSSTVHLLQPGFNTSTMPNEANGYQSESEVVAKEAKQSRMGTFGLQATKVEKLEEPANPASNDHKGHSTPDWIIILGFLVGLAALVLLCVAIATKDKWNGPQQVFKDETKTNSYNQTRALEMQTFLHREEPRENGREAEYTVIPLEDLPEKFSSH